MPVVITFDEADYDPAILLKVWRMCSEQINPSAVTLSDAGLPTTISGYGVTVAHILTVAAPKLTVVPKSPPATETNIRHLFSLYREVEGDPKMGDDDRHEFTREVLGRPVSWSWHRAEMTVADYEKLVAALSERADDDRDSEWITATEAQHLHVAWREASPGSSDTARHRFTRSVLGETPRWLSGGMTYGDAKKLLKAMEAR